MKLRIKNTFGLLMLRHHWPYITALVIFLALAVVFIPLQINSYLDLRVELDNLDQDITRLETEQKKIRSYDQVNLDDTLNVLESVFPNKPDRFSLFSNISILQDQHELIIQNFSSPFGDTSEELVGINVRSVASIQGFKGLISDYFYTTGKFTTLDRVFFDTETNDMNFTIYFHSKEINPNDGIVWSRDDELLAEVQEIKRTLQALGNLPTTTSFGGDGDIEDDYSSKTNPFSN